MILITKVYSQKLFNNIISLSSTHVILFLMYLWKYFRYKQYMIEKDKHTFLYSFLTDSKFRIWRHLLLVFTLMIISFNQIFIIYQDCSIILGNNIYWICFSALILYLIMIYFNLYTLVHKLLLKKKYTKYIIILSGLVLSLLLILLFQEYLIRTILKLPHRIESYKNPIILIDSLSAFMITIICFTGTSASVLFKNWVLESKHVNKLEQEHILSELDQLKEQITPNFLSDILIYTSDLTRKDTEKSSDILMKLGKLLRYQLYDCNRDKVLLISEINFLKGYLDLEKLHRFQFDYKISINGNINNKFVAPLLFIPFVQQMLEKVNWKDKSVYIDLDFKLNNDKLIFICQSKNQEIILNDELFSIRKRLDLLHSDKYLISATKGMVELQLNLIES